MLMNNQPSNNPTNGIPVPNQRIFPKTETTTKAATTVMDNNIFIKQRTCSAMRLTSSSGRNNSNTYINTDANTINTKKYNRRSTAF